MMLSVKRKQRVNDASAASWREGDIGKIVLWSP